MQEFINKYREQINGVLSGFDRLVFRGSLRRLNYGWWDGNLAAMVAQGMEQYLWQNGILFKDYLDHVKQVSQQVRKACAQPWEKQGVPIVSLRDPKAATRSFPSPAMAARPSMPDSLARPASRWTAEGTSTSRIFPTIASAK